MMNRQQRRALEKMGKKLEHPFEMKGALGLSLKEFKIIDKDGNDVTKDRIKESPLNPPLERGVE